MSDIAGIPRPCAPALTLGEKNENSPYTEMLPQPQPPPHPAPAPPRSKARLTLHTPAETLMDRGATKGPIGRRSRLRLAVGSCAGRKEPSRLEKGEEEQVLIPAIPS